MSVAPILFWVFAAMVVAGGLMAALVPHIIRAVFSLMLSFAGVAGIYFLAGADFLGVVQIVVYVGGVIVLMAFGILLTGRTALSLGEKEMRNRWLAIGVGAILFFGLLSAIRATSQLKFGAAPAGEPTTEGIGALLLGDYIIAFEFASVLLLVALVGAAYLVRRAHR
jgi:NADH-quinone oxidoreductase subunit J